MKALKLVGMHVLRNNSSIAIAPLNIPLPLLNHRYTRLSSGTNKTLTRRCPDCLAVRMQLSNGFDQEVRCNS